MSRIWKRAIDISTAADAVTKADDSGSGAAEEEEEPEYEAEEDEEEGSASEAALVGPTITEPLVELPGAPEVDEIKQLFRILPTTLEEVLALQSRLHAAINQEVREAVEKHVENIALVRQSLDTLMTVIHGQFSSYDDGEL
ncbi:unnamed protein product [Cyprideis torosa]|uniref:Uncharacterized protein n=1 Tax=Cyprideis torosa TaxID=163714 RepID=A0A7R8ZJA4_9CRUS|nr:unnamed protein product [Cyprideis torosa]CAG0879397.1 unnamed protein product [Cyprideis torosa]